MIKVNFFLLNYLLDANIEGFSKNIRVKLPDKDDDDVSDGEIDDDVNNNFYLFYNFLFIFRLIKN